MLIQPFSLIKLTLQCNKYHLKNKSTFLSTGQKPNQLRNISHAKDSDS